MALYYVACKISLSACKARRKQKYFQTKQKYDCDQEDETNWSNGELIKMGFSRSLTTVGISNVDPEAACESGTEIGQANNCSVFDESTLVMRHDGIVTDANGMILNGPLDALISLLIPQTAMEIDQNFVFSFLLSSRVFIQPHELLRKLIESVPESDESLERMVVLMQEWTRWFPYDFRGEEIMSLVKHIVARCVANSQLADRMSDMCSALLIKLTDLSRFEEEMKANKKSLSEPVQEWPTSPKLAQFLCRIEKKFAKHIGPEEFLQCSPNLIKQQSNYDVPVTSASTSTAPPTTETKKKTCNLENYFEWSNRLRLLVANEILQCNNEIDRTRKIELWSSVAQHCLLVGNYNSATSILQPIFRLQTMWKRFISLTNQQQLDCLLKHIENSQNLNLWSKQTEKSCHGTNRQKRIQIITPNSSPQPTHRLPPESSINKVQRQRPKSEWVVLPVFVDIVNLALKAREDASTRLPNGSINFNAFNELAAIVSAFTFHMSNVTSGPGHDEEFAHLVNHIFTCQLRDENELFAALEKEASKIESYYDVP